VNIRCCECVPSGSNPRISGLRIAASGPHRRNLLRRSVSLAGWMVPSATLALLPKCPACLAVYLAVGSGIGIPVAAASYLRAGLVIMCVTSLVYLVVSRGRLYYLLPANRTSIPNECNR
jgi:hypothetical protein